MSTKNKTRVCLWNKQNDLLKSILFIALFFVWVIPLKTNAQADFGTRTPHIINLSSFGATPNDNIDDSYALIKVARYIDNKWGINGLPLTGGAINIDYDTGYIRLLIDTGTYNVGKQIDILQTPYDTLYPCNTDSVGIKILTYSYLYGGANTQTAINIIPRFDNCLMKWRVKRYYEPELFYLNQYGVLTNPVDGVEIICSNPNGHATFKYADSIRVGFIDTLGNPVNHFGGCNYYWELYHAYNTPLFQFFLCKNVKMENIEIDGNNQTTVNLGWGLEGYQAGATGIRMGAKGVSLKNLHLHHLSVDGLYIQDNLCDTKTRVVGDSLLCEYNRRQGMTWSSGDSIYFSNSIFANSGKSVNAISGTPMSSEPASGLDIEYGSDCLDTSILYTIRNGEFKNCQFLNNKSSGIVNDYELALNHERTKNVLFKKCTIHDVDTIGSGIHVTGHQFVFDSCNIYATILNGYKGDTAGSETQYKNCRIEDLPYNGHYLPYYRKMIEQNNTRNTLFQNCTFQINDSAREFFWLNWGDTFDEEDRTEIDGCEFIYNNKGRPETYSSYIRNVRFKGNTRVRNILNSINSYHNFVTAKCILEGSDNSCSPNELNFEGQVAHIMMSSNLGQTDSFPIGYKYTAGVGYAQYHLRDKAILIHEGNTDLLIGKRSGMHIEKGGSIDDRENVGTFYVDGIFAAHAGSYLSLNTTEFDTTANTGDKLLYLDKDANKNNTTLSPLWSNGIGYGTGLYYPIYSSVWLDTTVTHCVQGTHPYPTNIGTACAPTLYANILCRKSMSLLYNKSIGCFGNTGNNNTFSFSVKGGSGAYEYTFDNNATLNTSFSNLYIGNHTLIVKDTTTQCKDTFIVNIDTSFEYKIIKGCVNGSTPAKFHVNTCDTVIVSGPAGAAITQSNDTVTVSAVGTYTIIATSPAGNDTTTLHIGNCTYCSTAPDSAEWYPTNTNSSNISPDGILENRTIVLQGTIPVDNEWFIHNNNKVYLGQNALLDVENNQALIVNMSKLRGCTYYWMGIRADNYNERVIINNYSTLQDMDMGVHVKDNAFLQARNSTYLNNRNCGIWFENIKEPAYKSSITNNTFKSDGNLLPYLGVTSCSGFSGIYIFNSTDIEVGDSAGIGNTFRDLYNGIFITGDANMPTILNNNTSRIGIYNNHFKNINYCETLGTYPNAYKIDNCYGNFAGAGIYADFGMVPSTFDARIDVRNMNDTNTVIRFENCDKAILAENSSVVAKNLYMNDNLMGIMCNGTTSKTLNIENNHINKAVIGMQFIGNNTYSVVKNNTIDSLHGTATGLYTNYWGTGIDVRQFTNADTSTFDVKENDIKVTSFAGRGINMENTGVNVHVLKNDIGLNCEDGDVVCISANLLNGINATNISKSLMYKNNITGNDSLNTMEREDITGILINNSDKPRVECNIADRTRFGISAISECLTDTDGVKGNTVNEQVLGWVFRHLGTEGTFGNVGTLQYDNHNLWTGNTQQYKVFKFCEDGLTDKIYTYQNFLDLPESNSYNIADQSTNTCPYNVQDNTGATIYTCPINFNFQQPFNTTSSGHFPHAEAISIATHTKTYSEYPEIAYWMDERKLYRDLDASYIYRNSNDTLLAFYDSLNTAVIEHIEATETYMANLIAGMASQNYDTYFYNMQQARESNSNVVSDEDQENNEAVVNEIFLRMLERGIDELNSDDSTAIAELAKQCPYIGGTAVYKARALYAMYAPANMFDDIAICNAIGVYKTGNNGKGKFDDENKYLRSLKPKENTLGKYAEHAFLLYPNPASTTVTIAYELNKNEKGNVIICDILGREQMKIDLWPDNNKVSINVSLLRQGIYMYKYLVNNRQQVTGKLLIE